MLIEYWILNNLLIEPTNIVDGLKVRVLLIRDGAYPVCTWHVKLYLTNANLSTEQALFNKSLCLARNPLERTIDILKARWRCLLNSLDHNKENVANVIVTCFIIHNICQIKRDSHIEYDDVLCKL